MLFNAIYVKRLGYHGVRESGHANPIDQRRSDGLQSTYKVRRTQDT